MSLIKPQFEAGREKIGKKGVVRESSTHIEVIQMIYDFAQNMGLSVLNLDYSPIKGPEGNIEYLMHMTKESLNSSIYLRDNINDIVENAHRELNGEKKWKI